MSGYPAALTAANHVEPAPRRVRAYLGGQVVVDTTAALYVWESPSYPQYYIPVGDVLPGVLVDEGKVHHTGHGLVRMQGLKAGGQERPTAARLVTESPVERLVGTVRIDWNAMGSWFEEDEEVFVHPRSPYVRVDALRSSRRVRVELEGVVLAESASPVMVFETGLPTRYYLPRTDVHFDHLARTDTETACPYKGVTSDYWAVRVGDTTHPDLAWSYDFPTRQLLPIAGLVAFYDEKVDTFVDGAAEERPVTHFS